MAGYPYNRYTFWFRTPAVCRNINQSHVISYGKNYHSKWHRWHRFRMALLEERIRVGDAFPFYYRHYRTRSFSDIRQGLEKQAKER
jgi:hypothetical protein